MSATEDGPLCGHNYIRVDGLCKPCERLRACYSALDGLNPAALAEVLDAAAYVVLTGEGIGDLDAALAKLHEVGP